MGTVHARITLRNVRDMGFARGGYIKKEEVRSLTVDEAIVDTGAMTLCINEEMRQKLGLDIEYNRPVRVANGERVSCQVTEPVQIAWKDRFTACYAYVVPGIEVTLLGVIPLEDMDLMVNPVARELVGIHGDDWLGMLY